MPRALPAVLALVCALSLCSHALASPATDIADKWIDELSPAVTPELEGLTERFTGRPAQRYSALGFLCQSQGIPGAAAWAFARAVVLEPEDGTHLSNFGFALTRISAHEDAIVVLQEAERKGGGAAAKTNLAFAKARVGDFEAAKAAAREACADAPDDHLAWMAYLGVILEEAPQNFGSAEAAAATEGLIAALGDGEAIVAAAQETIAAVYDQLEDDHQRAGQIYEALAARASAGLVDETYTETDVRLFEGLVEPQRRQADMVAQMRAMALERVPAHLDAVKQANPMAVLTLWNTFIEGCIAEIAGAVHAYELAHSGGQLDILFWTDILGESEVASEAYWMEESPFRPAEDQWWSAKKEHDVAMEAAETAAVKERIRRQYCLNVLDIWDNFQPTWMPWATETGAIYEDGSAERMAGHLHWVAVLHNATVQLEGYLVGKEGWRQRLGGRSLYFVPLEAVERCMCLDADEGGFGALHKKYANDLRHKTEWSFTKAKYRGGGGLPSAVITCANYLEESADDDRPLNIIEGALAFLVASGKGEMPPIELEVALTADLTMGVTTAGEISVKGDISVILDAARVRFVDLEMKGTYNVYTGAWAAGLEASLTGKSVLEGFVKSDKAMGLIKKHADPLTGGVLDTGVKGSVMFDSTGKSTLGMGYKLPVTGFMGGAMGGTSVGVEGEIFQVELKDIPEWVETQVGRFQGGPNIQLPPAA
ncbi:MAG: hypothetical protein GF320_17150 [Armatimonadia bacterium]|nr:hypothetical protein [Armatimonadia bacterium]